MSNLIKKDAHEFMSLDKQSIKAIASDYVHDVSKGVADPLQALILSKKMQELGKAIETLVRPIAEGNSTIGKEVFKSFNTEVSERETGVRYDYSACNDSEWNELNGQMNELKEKIAEREKFLKAINKPIADPETGEIINPAIRTGKMGLVVTLK